MLLKSSLGDLPALSEIGAMSPRGKPTPRRDRLRSAPRRELVYGPLIVFAFLVWWMPTLWRTTADQAASAAWPSTTATITESAVTKRSGGRSLIPQDHLELEYAYAVDGVEYTGRGYSMMRVLANWFEPPERIARQFPVGSQVEIRYAPAKHDVSTIRAGLALYDVLLALLAAILLLGAGVAPLRELRRRIRNAGNQESTG